MLMIACGYWIRKKKNGRETDPWPKFANENRCGTESEVIGRKTTCPPRGLQSLSPNWKSATGYRTPNGGIPDLRRDEKMPKRWANKTQIMKVINTAVTSLILLCAGPPHLQRSIINQPIVWTDAPTQGSQITAIDRAKLFDLRRGINKIICLSCWTNSQEGLGPREHPADADRNFSDLSQISAENQSSSGVFAQN
jgi:hypothetical protein